MAPETSDQSGTSPVRTVCSSDGDSVCALEESLDLKERFCTALGEFERNELKKFSAHRRVHSMRHGAIVRVTAADTPDRCCMRCGDKILVGDTAVCTERFQDEHLRWHLKCFVCETCHLPLSQFIYFLQDSRIYCGRHHAELTRARCAACDQLIMSASCTVAEGLCWHMEHFCCWECEMVLGGSRYVMKGGRPFCSGCFQHLHAESCEACGEPVDPDGQLVTLKGQYWHTLPSCFCCSSCRTPLHRSEFMIREDHLYCSQHGLSANPKMHCPSKYHLNTMRASAADFSPHVYCTTLNNTMTGSKRKEPRRAWLPENSQIMENEEDTSCSSTDSEPEGFFLGRPIQNYSLSKGTNSQVHGKSTSIKSRQSGKSCKVS
ncbi:prickle-like protein 4 isoform X2 [Rhinoderma darwinii]|uniref:prickle-like protein 4 isoform X2 n=1 Tax=Rhinoderma darwinii TaxID=43563 RepID=UPI003F675ABD